MGLGDFFAEEYKLLLQEAQNYNRAKSSNPEIKRIGEMEVYCYGPCEIILSGDTPFDFEGFLRRVKRKSSKNQALGNLVRKLRHQISGNSGPIYEHLALELPGLEPCTAIIATQGGKTQEISFYNPSGKILCIQNLGSGGKQYRIFFPQNLMPYFLDELIFPDL